MTNNKYKLSYYFGNPLSDSLSWRAYRRHQQYYETNYDPNSPVEQYKRERSRIDIVSPGLENSDLDLDPNPKACRWRDEVLILVADGANLLCQGCGKRTPTTSTSSYNSTDKGKPTLPKESKSSKLKQIDSGK